MLFEKSIWLNMTTDIEVLPIIHDVKLAIRESQVQEGLMTVYVPDGKGAIVLAPEGLEKDRALLRWLRDWSTEKPKVKEEQPTRFYLSHLFGASQTLPLAKGEIKIDLHATLYFVDFTEVQTRREFRIGIFSESPKKEPQVQRRR